MKHMKKTVKFAFIVMCVILIAGCGVTPSPTMNIGNITDSPQTTAPKYTLSPIIPKPSPTAQPSSPPTAPPQSEEYYIYTLDEGDGEFPYAWTDERPISGEIKYGTKSSAEVRALQARLTQLGFYCGGVTGTFNAKTLTALNEFQATVGLEKTADLTEETIDVLYSQNGIEAMSIQQYDIPEGVLDGITVFVDAGHGGRATGTALNALVEKTLVLELSYRLKDMLEKSGARVIMTRSDDTAISLTYRSALVNDTILSDLYDETYVEILKLENKIKNIKNIGQDSATEILQRAKDLLGDIKTMLTPLKEAAEYVEYTKTNFGQVSSEYSDALRKQAAIEEEAASLREKYELIMQIYYLRQMGVSEDSYVKQFENNISLLTEYMDKLLYYRNLLQININDPYAEYEGIWEKNYDENDYKIIDSELKNILDLTGEKCSDKYVFISVHINGVDNAAYVNGTEVYVKNINSTNNNYGVNRYYYSNYNVAARGEFASSIKNAIDTVIPLENDKASVIKDSDLWVLREINIPCVLVETGYVTNEYDRIKLLEPQTRNAFAFALWQGVCDYYLS